MDNGNFWLNLPEHPGGHSDDGEAVGCPVCGLKVNVGSMTTWESGGIQLGSSEE